MNYFRYVVLSDQITGAKNETQYEGGDFFVYGTTENLEQAMEMADRCRAEHPYAQIEIRDTVNDRRL